MLLSREQRNILLLAGCQALFWGTLMIGISLSGLVGQILADHPALATLPAGILALTTVFVTRPASLLMQRFGRRVGFLLGALAGLIGGLICTAGIFASSFSLFCLGNVVLGVYQAIGQYYRLAATDYSVPERRGRAVSTVMAGGVVAAFIAPGLSVWSKDLFFPVLFAGSYLAVSALSLAAMALIVALAEQSPAKADASPGGRPLSEIIRQPLFIVAIVNAGVAHGVMVLVMLATPLAMVACGYPVADATVVIQWHVLGMFLPSFLSGQLVDRLGAGNVAMVGAAILCLSATVAAAGIEFLDFSVALTLLGIGWNFMYVAGTTMITVAHRPEERGRAQGAAEMSIASIAAVAAFASGGLLDGLGWAAVNFSATPILIATAGLTFWYTRQVPVRTSESSV